MGGKGNPQAGINHTIGTGRIGDGYRADYPLQLGSGMVSTGATLGTATTPVRDVNANQARILWAAADEAALMFAFRLPGEFSDTARDLVVVADMLETGGTDTITMTATIYTRKVGGAVQGPFTATAVLTKSGTNPEEVIFNFENAEDASGDKIEPGDDITLTIAPGAHGTDAASLYGASVRLKRNSALTNLDHRVRSNA